MKKIKHCAGCLFKINYLSQNTCVSAIISVALIFGGIGFDSVFAAGNANLMVCGDFENGFDGWTNIKNLNSDAAISSDYAYAGSGGLKLVGAMNEQYMYKLVDFDRTKSCETQVCFTAFCFGRHPVKNRFTGFEPTGNTEEFRPFPQLYEGDRRIAIWSSTRRLRLRGSRLRWCWQPCCRQHRNSSNDCQSSTSGLLP